jgi:hypothetical protein
MVSFILMHVRSAQVIVACRDLESAKRAAAGLRGETINGTCMMILAVYVFL